LEQIEIILRERARLYAGSRFGFGEETAAVDDEEVAACVRASVALGSEFGREPVSFSDETR